MKTQFKIALKLLIIMTILTGIIYPLFITGIARIAFHNKANGSLTIKNGVIAGSELIGQKFDSVIYFWPRPSAIDYNPLPSSGSNFGPTSGKLKKAVEERKAEFITVNRIKDTAAIPSEMVLASASGLDPHISPEAARLQVDRIAKARNFSVDQKNDLFNLVERLIEKPQFKLFGEERINVFMLNLELDKIE
jgi:K+-transporting ATPase ATPase C chain